MNNKKEIVLQSNDNIVSKELKEYMDTVEIIAYNKKDNKIFVQYNKLERSKNE